MPLWASSMSTAGTQLIKVRPDNATQVSHGGTSFTSKNPFELYFAAPSIHSLTGNRKQQPSLGAIVMRP